MECLLYEDREIEEKTNCRYFEDLGGFFSYFLRPSSMSNLIALDIVFIRFSKRKSSRRFINSLSTAKFNMDFLVGIEDK